MFIHLTKPVSHRTADVQGAASGHLGIKKDLTQVALGLPPCGDLPVAASGGTSPAGLGALLLGPQSKDVSV